MRRIKRFAPLQLGKMLGILYAFMGLIFVPFFLLASIFGAMIPHKQGGPPAAATAAFGVGFTLMIPVLYGVLGFIAGIISAWIYNLVAKWIGGIEVEVE